MMHQQRIPSFRIACLTALSVFLCLFTDQSHAAPADIPAKEITALQKDLTEIKSQSSAAKKRRSCKSIIRKGNSLIDASPTAPNRFHVLAIMFQSQKLLLGMENSDRNRESLFKICGKLAKAPDTYATQRLDADLLFSNMTLDQKNASKEERTKALTALIARYRDTPAEPKCLMIASMIARAIEAKEFEDEIVTLMTERHASNADVVQFRLKNLGFGRADVPFIGTFKRADGTTLSFPIDQLGHASIVVFWSTKMPGHQEELKKIHEEMAPYATHLSVFSFNIDQLPDAGEKQLRALGLNWTAVHLPDGKNSRPAKIFAITKPQGYLINPHGHVLLMSSLAKYGRGHGATKEVLISDQFMPHTRSLAQLQSMYAGDFLAHNPNKKITAIHDCFTPAPMRYRLTPEQALANYTQAEKLCRELIAQSPTSPDLWQIRNLRIISLLGMWKTAIEPKHLDAAVAEAKTTLATNLPKGANVVPQFCLAKSSLRQENADAESILTTFIKACDGDDSSAYAAASILALEAHSRSLHDHYREKFLAMHKEEDAALWPVAAFLRDRYHQFNLLHATDQRRERKESRSNIIHHGWSTSTRPFPNLTLKTLDGKSLTLPKDTQGKQTLILFIEPPTEGDIPISLIGKPAEGKKRGQQGAVDYAWKRASEHIHNEVNMVVAFLTKDTNRIKALVKKHDWKFQVATVPDTISNRAIRQLGVISADEIANIFLLRRNGTIAWQTTGLKHKFSFSHQFSAYLGLTVHIELLDITLAYKALEKGNYQEAARLFAGPFAKKKDERFGWTAPRYHARALANMKLKQWDTALEDIDKAISYHNPKSFRHDPNHPCDTMREMQAIRAIVLKNLGKTDESKAAEKIATQKPTTYRTGIYSDFHMKLKALRLKTEKNP